MIATDISQAALKISATNSASLNANVRFIRADLIDTLADNAFDVVASNPPYVPIGVRKSMQKEVRDWEPHLALFAGVSGLDIYRRLIPEARRVLKPGGLLALELGFGQADAVAALLKSWHNMEIDRDLAGISRVISCEKPGKRS